MFKRAILVLVVSLSALASPAFAGGRIYISSWQNVSSSEKRHLRKALAYANKVLQSSTFRSKLRAKRGFFMTKHSGKTIFRKIMAKDYHIKFVGRHMGRRSRTNAATRHGGGYIAFNVDKFDRLSPQYLAGTIIHEVTHLLGYSHWTNKASMPGNRNSVPFWVGRMSRSLAHQISRSERSRSSRSSSASSRGLVGALGGMDAGSSTASAARTSSRRSPSSVKKKKKKPCSKGSWPKRLACKVKRAFRLPRKKGRPVIDLPLGE